MHQCLDYLRLLLKVCYFCFRVTDERLLVSCCSQVTEWLVTAEDDDSTIVNIPDGMLLNDQVYVIEHSILTLLVELKVS